MPDSPRYRTVVVPDFRDRRGRWVRVCNHRGLRVATWSGEKFAGMLSRCSNSKRLSRFPSYAACASGFEDFHSFVDWVRGQAGYGLDWHLDKDILVKNSKIYSPETCCLVPRQVNQLFAKNDVRRGACPVGVRWDPVRERYAAQLSIDGKITGLGRHGTVADAFCCLQISERETDSSGRTTLQRISRSPSVRGPDELSGGDN